jgi:hypothetical protein
MRMITRSIATFSRCLIATATVTATVTATSTATATATAIMQVLHEANDAVVVVLDQIAFL